MKRFKIILLLMTLMVFACTSSAFASTASIGNASLDFMRSEEYVHLSNQILE